MKDLPKRALTAIIFAAIMLGGLMWNRISFSVLLLIIQTGCLYEYLMLVKRFQVYPGKNQIMAFIISMSAGVLPMIVILFVQSNFLTFTYSVLLFPLCLVLFAAELFFRSGTPLTNAALNAAGLLYVVLPVICFYSLADDMLLKKEQSWFPYYCTLPLGIVLLIWANDTFAYFTGRLFGKHKILPAVSPKKSWEGFFGGLFFALITAGLLSRYFTRLDLEQWMIVAAITVAFGTLGDFFESMIKRQAGVKDSGNLFPGHGGFLDRFDALLFCLPFVTLYLLFINS